MTAPEPGAGGLFPRRGLRLFLAGPVALIASVAAIVGLGLYAPVGPVDRIILPIIVFPFLYVGFFFLVLMTGRLWPSALLLSAVIAGNALLIAGAMT